MRTGYEIENIDGLWYVIEKGACKGAIMKCDVYAEHHGVPCAWVGYENQEMNLIAMEARDIYKRTVRQRSVAKYKTKRGCLGYIKRIDAYYVH